VDKWSFGEKFRVLNLSSYLPWPLLEWRRGGKMKQKARLKQLEPGLLIGRGVMK